MFDANNKPLKTGDTVSVSCTIVTPAPEAGLASLLRVAIPDHEGRQPEMYLEDGQFSRQAVTDTDAPGDKVVVKFKVLNAESTPNGTNTSLEVLTPDKTGWKLRIPVNSKQVTKD